MKKLLLPILLFVIAMPFMVDAKEYCEVVSGNGKDFGSEMVCGTEHFYVLSNKDNHLRVLAKYNLYTGYTIERYPIEREEGDTRSNTQYCNDISNEKGAPLKISYYGLQIFDTEHYCFLERPIDDSEMKQSEQSIGAHIDENGNYLYPQVGDVYLNNSTTSNPDAKEIDTSVTYSNQDFMDFKITLNNATIIGDKLTTYKETLSEMGYEVSSIDLFSLSELEKIVKDYNNTSFPLQEWGDAVKSLPISYGPGGSVRYNTVVTFGDIKNLIPQKYSWLYSTTYWNKTIYRPFIPENPGQSNTYSGYYHLFTTSFGKICGSGSAYCQGKIALGCGIRPVIEIDNTQIKYNIKTETEGNGTIEAIENSLGGETIQFKVSAKNGYKLGSIVIKTDSGEEVEFSEGEITKNDDGTFSIDKNKFTMPFENVTIEAKFESENILKNPETGNKVLFIILILVASIGIGTLIYIKKESRYNV